MIRIGSANFYVGNKQPEKDAKFLASLGVDLAGIQEGHSGNAYAIKRALKGTHRVFWGKKNTIAEQDSAIVIKKTKGFKVKKVWAKRISERSMEKNLGMPRTATFARIKYSRKKYLFVNTHMNAAVQNRRTGEPLSRKIKRVAEYVKGVVILEGTIARHRAAGYRIILVGDLNYRTVKSGWWRYSPQGLFKRQRMDFKVHGIDYIGYSKKMKVKNFKVIPKTKTGADHPWLILDVE